jgi:hypothetical protein
MQYGLGYYEKRLILSLLFLTESLRTQKIGRELVFSADLWYNGNNKTLEE